MDRETWMIAIGVALVIGLCLILGMILLIELDPACLEGCS